MKQIHIFDLDGTLIDSMPFFARGVLQVLEIFWFLLRVERSRQRKS